MFRVAQVLGGPSSREVVIVYLAKIVLKFKAEPGFSVNWNHIFIFMHSLKVWVT